MRVQVGRVCAVAAVVVWLPTAMVFAETKAERARLAAQLVGDALRQEVDGTNGVRAEKLQSALEKVPDHEAALWQSGYVLERKKWRNPDEVAALAAGDLRLAAYRRQRETTSDTIEGQLALAQWCAKRRLTDQRRAHLTAVLQIDPNHAKARRQLGHRLVDGVWMTERGIDEAKRKNVESTAALKRWSSTLREIREAIAHHSQRRRQDAAERLRAIDDPDAIGPVEAMLSGYNEGAALAMVDWLSSMTAREASRVLARQGVFSPWDEVRDVSAQCLKDRDPHTFVPELLATMGAPIVSRAELYRAPTGRLVYRHTFAREGQDWNQVAVFETEYVDRALIAGSAVARAQQMNAAASAQMRETAAAQRNEVIQQYNERVCAVLAAATNGPASAAPGDWWTWWNEYNEVYFVGAKPTRTFYSRDEVAFSRSTPGNRSSYECLVAGTPVWTETGRMPVEQIEVGDRVLSQDPTTGELAYKLVLRTTERSPEHLLRLRIGSETIQCTGGHPFWVPGQGWLKARHLEPGMRLHTVTGAYVIDAVERTGYEATYNLVVADFHTYLVGKNNILTHDNTIREPTAAIVPGLVEP